MKATLVGDVPGRYHQKLWRLDDGKHVVSSAARMIMKTMVFNADEDGKILDWSDVGFVPRYDHIGAMKSAGFEVK